MKFWFLHWMLTALLTVGLTFYGELNWLGIAIAWIPYFAYWIFFPKVHDFELNDIWEKI